MMVLEGNLWHWTVTQSAIDTCTGYGLYCFPGSRAMLAVAALQAMIALFAEHKSPAMGQQRAQ
jgi:hypothetical protein